MAEQDFDDLLITLKTSNWNLFHFFIMGLAFFVVPPVILGGVFLAPKLDHICHPNFTGQEIISVNDCTYTIGNINGTKNSSIECTEWDYDRGYFNSTMTEEMNLVCERAYLRPTYHISYMLGYLIGAPINGFLSDKFGRRKCFVFGTIIGFVTQLGSTFISSIHVIVTLRIITGSFFTVLLSGYILCLEICEPAYRSVVGILLALPWAAGTIWYGALGYMVKDWRWLQRISILPGIMAIPLLRFCSESPRWLIVNGDFKKAMSTLRHAAKWNRSKLPPEDELLSRMMQIQKYSLIGKNSHMGVNNKGRLINIFRQLAVLFRTREMRRIILLMYVLFFSAATVFYGLSMNAINFHLNPYLYMVVGGLMEVPAYSVTIPITAKFGRIVPSVTSYIVCGIVILVLAFIPTDYIPVIITLAMVGKLCIAAAYQFIFLIGMEVFPTECRTQAFATSLFVARLGSIAAPYITDSMISSQPWVPSALFGSISIIAGISTLFVPETLNCHLPETIAMLEDSAKKNKSRKEVEMINNAS